MTKTIVPIEYIKETLKLKEDIEGAFLHLGERLHNIRQGDLWKGSYNTYSEFLQHMGISDGHASKLTKIYSRFVLDYGVSQMKLAKIGIQKLYIIMPMCTDKKSLEVALESIKGLSSQDVNSMVKENKHGKHKCEGEIVKMMVCGECGKMSRVYEQ